VSIRQVQYKVATEPLEFEQIFQLAYDTFVEEIPQHQPNPDRRHVDRFHDENTYLIAKDDDAVVGMLAIRAERPFSLDEKLGTAARAGSTWRSSPARCGRRSCTGTWASWPSPVVSAQPKRPSSRCI
jgi:hypothetical protein